MRHILANGYTSALASKIGAIPGKLDSRRLLFMSDQNRKTIPAIANDSLTTAHIEKGLTTAHIQQRLERQPAQPVAINASVTPQQPQQNAPKGQDRS